MVIPLAGVEGRRATPMDVICQSLQLPEVIFYLTSIKRIVDAVLALKAEERERTQPSLRRLPLLHGISELMADAHNPVLPF